MEHRGTRFGSLAHYAKGGVEVSNGFSPKRSMLLVWENASPELPELYASGTRPPTPVRF